MAILAVIVVCIGLLSIGGSIFLDFENRKLEHEIKIYSKVCEEMEKMAAIGVSQEDLRRYASKALGYENWLEMIEDFQQHKQGTFMERDKK